MQVVYIEKKKQKQKLEDSWEEQIQDQIDNLKKEFPDIEVDQIRNTYKSENFSLEYTRMILESIQIEVQNRNIQQHYDFIEQIQIDEIRMEQELIQIFQDFQIDKQMQVQMIEMSKNKNQIEEEEEGDFNFINLYEKEFQDIKLQDYEQLDESNKEKIIKNVQFYIQSYQDQINFQSNNQKLKQNDIFSNNYNSQMNNQLGFNQDFLSKQQNKTEFDFPELKVDNQVQNDELIGLQSFKNKRKRKTKQKKLYFEIQDYSQPNNSISKQQKNQGWQNNDQQLFQIGENKESKIDIKNLSSRFSQLDLNIIKQYYMYLEQDYEHTYKCLCLFYQENKVRTRKKKQQKVVNNNVDTSSSEYKECQMIIQQHKMNLKDNQDIANLSIQELLENTKFYN